MINALHIVYSGLGGSANVVFSLIEADLKQQNFNNSIIFTGPVFLNDFQKKSKKLKLKFNWIKTIKFFSFISYFSIFNSIKKFKPDVIFLNNYFIIPCIFYKLFFPQIKIFLIYHNSKNLFSTKDFIFKIFKSFINKIIFLNYESYLFFKKKFKLTSKKISLIDNGINLNLFSSIKYKNIKKKFFKIGMACRIEKIKKYNLILKALNAKNLKKLNIKFSLVGTGADLKNFRLKVLDLKLQNKILTPGYLNESSLKKWYSSLDLYILASEGEASPITLFEAMAMKVPVIGSKVSGIMNILEREKYVGLLFKNHENDLSNKIRYFYYLNKNIKNKYINKQFEYVKKYHSNKIMLKKYLHLCK